MLLITNCLTVKIKGVISDLIGVLYLFCFHCTYDDRVDHRNNILFGIQRSRGILIDNISTQETKVMVFMMKHPVRTKMEVNGKILEQVFCFNYLGCDISPAVYCYVENTLDRLKHVEPFIEHHDICLLYTSRCV